MRIILGKRSRTSEKDFRYVYEHIGEFISPAETAAYELEIRNRIASYGEPFALAYSAGKDSIALKYELDSMGTEYRSLCYYSPDFEFESTARFVEECGPSRCVMIPDRITDDKFIKRHYSELVFPQKASPLTYFYRAQEEMHEMALKPYGIHTLITGKRRKDDNNCELVKERKFYKEFSPMWDMPHEAVFGIIRYHGLKLPKCYDFIEDAFTLGTCYYFEPLRHGRTEREMWDWLGGVEPETLAKACNHFEGARSSYADLIKKKE